MLTFTEDQSRNAEYEERMNLKLEDKLHIFIPKISLACLLLMSRMSNPVFVAIISACTDDAEPTRKCIWVASEAKMTVQEYMCLFVEAGESSTTRCWRLLLSILRGCGCLPHARS